MEHEPHIQTYGELAPQFMIELVAGEVPGSGLTLLLWDGTEQHIQSSVRLEAAPGSEFKAREFRAPELDSSIPRAIRFPTHAAAYESDRELLDEICTLIEKYTGLNGKLASLAAHAVLASWAVDCIESPVCLSIVGPQSSEGRQLVRLLGCLYRRPLRLSDMTLSGVSSLPMALRPSLFVEHCEPNKDLEKFLRASSARDTFVSRSGRLVDLSCAKVIWSEDSLDKAATGDSVIEIPVTSSLKPLPTLDARAQRQIADRFQPLLLMFRLKHYQQVADSDFDVPEFAPPVRELARSLGACVSHEPELQGGVLLLLEELNELALSEPPIDLNGILVEAMLSLCHEDNKDSLHVGVITARVNKILDERGERLEMKPKSVGHRLKALGISTRRLDAAGRGVLLLEAVCERIHKLAVDYQLPAVRSVQSCRHCHVQNDTPRGEIDLNTLPPDEFDALF